MNIKQRRIHPLSIIGILAAITLLAATLIDERMVTASPAAQLAAGAEPLVITGSYAGSVTISEPAPLGALDLALSVIDTSGALSGQVDAARTQVFLGGPSFTGSVTASQGVTPTFRIDSAVFAGIVSGRSVQRQFTLAGEVLNEANTLRGQYTETITGFTPHPLLVTGKFLLVRPNGSRALPPDGPNTPTATATATATTNPVTPATATATSTATATATATAPTGGGGSTSSVFVPLIMDNNSAVRGAEVAAGLEPVLVAEPTATPQPTPTAQPVETVTIPEAAQAVDAVATPEAAQTGSTIYLPVVVR